MLSRQDTAQAINLESQPSAEDGVRPAPSPQRERETHYSAWPSMIGPNNCHFSPVNFIIWTCSIG
jgi:hypothetical protein